MFAQRPVHPGSSTRRCTPGFEELKAEGRLMPPNPKPQTLNPADTLSLGSKGFRVRIERFTQRAWVHRGASVEVRLGRKDAEVVSDRLRVSMFGSEGLQTLNPYYF